MKRKNLLLATFFMLLFTFPAFAAQLPSSGYDGPYQYDNDDNDFFGSDIYAGSSGNFSIMAEGDCTGGEIYYFSGDTDPYCIMPDPCNGHFKFGDICTTCYSFLLPLDENGKCNFTAYEECKNTIRCSDPLCPVHGRISLPIGKESVLFVFALLYSGILLRRQYKKKSALA